MLTKVDLVLRGWLILEDHRFRRRDPILPGSFTVLMAGVQRAEEAQVYSAAAFDRSPYLPPVIRVLRIHLVMAHFGPAFWRWMEWDNFGIAAIEYQRRRKILRHLIHPSLWKDMNLE